MSAGGFLDACGFIPASNGTGTFTVSVAVTGYQTPASAGAVNATVYSYRAESTDKSQWEEGFGAYTVSGTTLARSTITANSSGGATAINFTAAPNVYITAATADLQNASLLTSGTLPAARIAFAAQSDQETGTSTTLPIAPGTQKFHPSAAKAWVVADFAGGIRASYNVTSVTDTAVARQTVNYTTAFSSASAYAAVATAWTNDGSIGVISTIRSDVSQAAGTTEIITFNNSASSADSIYASLVAFGDQ